MFKWIFFSISGILAVLIIIFSLGIIDLGFYKFFKPRQENVRREVFENTQSYTHGKIQQLAKMYNEYNEAGSDDKEAIKQMIIIQFAEFDASKITSLKLKLFLENTRGY